MQELLKTNYVFLLLWVYITLRRSKHQGLLSKINTEIFPHKPNSECSPSTLFMVGFDHESGLEDKALLSNDAQSRENSEEFIRLSERGCLKG